MSIAYSQYRDGRSTIKHPMGLVIGWLVSDHATGLETRYALFETGKVLRSLDVDSRGRTCYDFDFPALRWQSVDTVPDSACFIGYYQPPRPLLGECAPGHLSVSEIAKNSGPRPPA